MSEVNAQQLYERNLQRYRQGKYLDSSYLYKPIICADEPLASAYLRAIALPNPLQGIRELLGHLQTRERTDESTEMMILCHRAVYTALLQQNEYRAAFQELRTLEQLGDQIDAQLGKLLQVMGYAGGLAEELAKAENYAVREIYYGNGMELLKRADAPQGDKVDYFKY